MDMTADAQRILEEALALPEDERRVVAEVLYGSLEHDAGAQHHAAWREEILRRIEQVRAGEVTLASWDDARAKGREALSRR